MLTRKRIFVNGIVQGIGFRPYVYLLAHNRGLNGFVFNTKQGIIIEVEGEEGTAEGFISDLRKMPPPHARITRYDVSTLPVQGDRDFIIKESHAGGDQEVVIPPDLALCPDCFKELTDPHNRRYRYPFLNCTQCGPRLTIIRRVPYDRDNTSMSSFPMCKECEREFHDPRNRRFHAQPNACPQCGPHVWLTDARGIPVEGPDPVTTAIRLIRQGKILAVKGLGGFHLAVDATKESAVRALRLRKSREGKPFALMSANLEKVREYAELSHGCSTLLQGAEHPILLLPKKKPNPIAPSVAPHQRCFGVMLPYTPLHVLLLGGQFLALVMTSGNMTDEPIVISNQEALVTLSNIADYFLLHNRDILVRCDDSIVMPVQGRAFMVRRSRGYVPTPVVLNNPSPPVLALGGQMKNTLCVVRDNRAFLSQHIGDLDGPGARRFFIESMKRTQEIAGVFPDIVAHDLHPDYYTTHLASGMEAAAFYAIQHHHAHMVSCMADNNLTGRALGLIFDGTGYGIDGTIWGGEVLIGDETSFDRVAHLTPFPLPGGDAAIKNPWRSAAGVLYQSYGAQWCQASAPVIGRILPRGEIEKIGFRLFNDILRKGINVPITSSMGRLFDAVAALLGFHRQICYEGQAAIELEYLASLSTDGGMYPIELDRTAIPWRMQIAPIVQGILLDISQDVPRETISRRFHNTVIHMASQVAQLCCKKFDVSNILLSGGCFQNRFLLEGIINRLSHQGSKVYIHRQVPTNDGGISLGQAVCAGALHAWRIPYKKKA